MKHFTPKQIGDGATAIMAWPVRSSAEHLAQNGNHAYQKSDQPPVIVDYFNHSVDPTQYFDTEFHPAFSFSGGMNTDGSASNTFTRPAGESCQHDSPRDLSVPLAVPRISADARRVVANPEQYADRPILRRLAWMALMADRGQRVDQNRLAQMPVEGLS